MALVKTNGNSRTELVRVTPATSSPAQLPAPDTKETKAQRQWDRVAARLREITPSELAHFVLVAAAIVGLAWLTWVSWTAFLPFEIGLVLAYITLPLVNRLSNYMPRTAAALLVMLAEVAFIVAFFAFLIPVVVQEIGRAVQGLPSQDELRAFFTDLRAQVNTLPDPIPSLVGDWSQQTANNIRSNIGDYVGRLLGLIANTAIGLVATLTFVVSLLVLPTWLLAVLRDQPRAIRAARSAIPRTIRTDALAVARIVDRTLRVYLRGLLLSGVVVSIIVYSGFILLEQLGFGQINYKIILAILAGLAMLIPTFGPIIGTIPPVLITLAYSQEAALAVLLLYIGAYWLVGSFITPRLQGESVNLHPAILAMVLVAGSEFGPFGILLAAPVAIIARDLFRYVYGRTSDPPRPAGLLPGGESIVESRQAAGRRQ